MKALSRACVLGGGVVVLAAGTGLSGSMTQEERAGGDPLSYRGLEMTVTDVQHSRIVSLQDCPPGDNTQRGVTRPGEQFAVVTVSFRVLPEFEPWIMPRPVLSGTAGQTFNTAVSFVDVGSVPEFSCAFPFRVPDGTELESFLIEEATLDLTDFTPSTGSLD